MDNQKFEVKVFDQVPENLVEQVDRLLTENGSNNRISEAAPLSGESAERFTSRADRIKYILAFDGDKVVGTTFLFKRMRPFKGSQLILGGIGAVGTMKEYRGKGIATKMLSTARQELEKAGAEVAFLCTDIHDPMLVKIYNRIGFVLLEHPYTYLGKSGQRFTEQDAMIAPINSQEKFDEVLKDTDTFDLGSGTW